MKSFLFPSTGKIVEHPDHFADLYPELIEVIDGVPCVDCVVKMPEEDTSDAKTEEVLLQEPIKATPAKLARSKRLES